MKALVTGATGLIGSHLIARLDRPRILARDPTRARMGLDGVDAMVWDSYRALPSGALAGVDAVFHLAGEPIAGGRWTTARKERIRDSRVLGTRRLVAALQEASERPRVLVCASAIGFYGSRGNEELTEDSASGSDFLAAVCGEWEREALAAKDLGVRVVCARIGIVLAREGGALAAIRKPFRIGLGGPLGSGLQWMSWIHVDDVVGLLLHAAGHSDLAGPFNLCAPTPVRNLEFARALGRVMHRPAWVRTPAVALRVAMGEMADVVLASQRVRPAKAEATGYVFRFAAIEEVLQHLLSI